MTTEAPTPAVVVEALGVPVGIAVSDHVAARVRRQWSRALTDRAPDVVVEPGASGELEDAVHDYDLTTRVTLAALTATSGTRVNLHAGVVADAGGRAISLVGPSGSGKTTAITLLASRLGYLSDETTSVDEDLLVHPHPKPLSVIADPLAPHLKESVSPDDLGLLLPPTTAHLHRIVLLHRGDDAPGIRPLAASRAIAEIVEQSSSLVQLDHPLDRLATLVDACGGAWTAHYAEFADVVDRIVSLLDDAPRDPEPRVHHPGPPTVETVPGAWSRTRWHDAVEYDEELVVMVSDRVHVLAGLGVVLWLALEAPRTLDELVAEVTAQWGERADARDLVGEALGVLVGQGLLVGPD